MPWVQTLMLLCSEATVSWVICDLSLVPSPASVWSWISHLMSKLAEPCWRPRKEQLIDQKSVCFTGQHCPNVRGRWHFQRTKRKPNIRMSFPCGLTWPAAPSLTSWTVKLFRTSCEVPMTDSSEGHSHKSKFPGPLWYTRKCPTLFPGISSSQAPCDFDTTMCPFYSSEHWGFRCLPFPGHIASQ